MLDRAVTLLDSSITDLTLFLVEFVRLPEVSQNG